MQIVRKIISITKPYWRRVAGGIILSLLVSGTTAAIAWFVKPALDEVFVKGKYEYMKFIPAGIVLMFTLRGILNFAQAYLMKSSGMKLVRETRNRLYNHIICLPLAFFHKESSGVIISRTINDVERLEGIFSDVIAAVIVETPTVVFLLGVAFYRRWDLTLLILALLPLLGYSAKKFGKRVKAKRKEAQKKLSLLTHKIGETILGARVIKVFNRENMVSERFKRENERYYREILRLIRIKEFTKLIIDITTGVGIAVAVLYGAHLIAEKIITPGDLASIIVAVYMIFSPVKKIGEAYNALQETRASLERIDTLFDAAQEKSGTTKIDGFRKAVSFENVSFAYPGTKSFALKDINLNINNGEVVAVVGRSGVGKSTLVDLIPGFIKPSRGAITIDGMNLNELELQSLRELIGIVSQDVILFNDTIKENIAFGRKGATESEIVEAAKLAYADEFISGLPEKYETELGERGLNLSGGQRQRIAIARAILKNPPILILDEATSSLDSVSEAIVQKALEKLMKGRTTIVIAHRLSTIKNANRIVILDKGNIAGIGTHNQLILENDTYMKLYNAFSFT